MPARRMTGNEDPVQEVGDVRRRDAGLAGEDPVALVAARQRAEDRHGGVVERDVTGSAMLRAGDGGV